MKAAAFHETASRYPPAVGTEKLHLLIRGLTGAALLGSVGDDLAVAAPIHRLKAMLRVVVATRVVSLGPF